MNRHYCVFYVPLVAVALIAVRARADDEVVARVVREGYLHNRERFHAFDCRFRVTEGTATSVRDAVAGRLTDTRTSSGRWAVDGERFRYSLVCDVPEKLSPPERPTADDTATGPAMTAVACASEELLSDGVIDLRFADILKAANIALTSSDALAGPVKTPLSTGSMGRNEQRGPGELLRQALTGDLTWRLEGVEDAPGGPRYTITVEKPGDLEDRWRLTWIFDAAQGFFPVETTFYVLDNKCSFHTFVTKLRRCQGGQFIPERSVMVRHPEGAPPFRVEVIELLSLELGAPPPAALSIELPPGTMCANPSNMRSYIRLRKPETVGVTDLPSLLARCTAALKERGERQKAEPPTGPPPGPPSRNVSGARGTLLGLNVVVVVVLAALIVRRRMQSTQRPGSSAR